MEEEQKSFDNFIDNFVKSKKIAIIISFAVMAITYYFSYWLVKMWLFETLNLFFTCIAFLLIAGFYFLLSFIIGLVVREISKHKFCISRKKFRGFISLNKKQLLQVPEFLKFLEDKWSSEKDLYSFYQEQIEECSHKSDYDMKKYYERKLSELKDVSFEEYLDGLKIEEDPTVSDIVSFLHNNFFFFNEKSRLRFSKEKEDKLKKLSFSIGLRCLISGCIIGGIIGVIGNLLIFGELIPLEFVDYSLLSILIPLPMLITGASIISSGIDRFDKKITYCPNCRAIGSDYLADTKSSVDHSTEEKSRDVYSTADVFDNSGSKVGSVRAKTGSVYYERDVITHSTERIYNCIYCNHHIKSDNSYYSTYGSWK